MEDNNGTTTLGHYSNWSFSYHIGISPVNQISKRWFTSHHNSWTIKELKPAPSHWHSPCGMTEQTWREPNYCILNFWYQVKLDRKHKAPHCLDTTLDEAWSVSIVFLLFYAGADRDNESTWHHISWIIHNLKPLLSHWYSYCNMPERAGRIYMTPQLLDNTCTHEILLSCKSTQFLQEFDAL